MKKIVAIVVLMQFGNVLFAQQQAEQRQGKTTFHVMTDGGKPVSDVEVTVSAFLRWQRDEGFGKDIYKDYKEKTNKNGLAAIEFSSARGDIRYGVLEAPGYYLTRALEYHFNKLDNGKWMPWNPTIEIILKPILNPIPMYARSLNTIIPTSHQDYGYDLVVGDWVAPMGKGERADLVFKLDGEWKSFSDNDSKLIVHFSNEKDGIVSFDTSPAFQGSQLRSPRFAPAEGYQKELILRRIRKPDQTDVSSWVDDAKQDRNYFIRLRTEVDSDGEIVSANYGKIYGGFKFAGASNQGSFLKIPAYYFNPTANDRNMEFDPKQNLAGDLPLDERVTEP